MIPLQRRIARQLSTAPKRQSSRLQSPRLACLALAGLIVPLAEQALSQSDSEAFAQPALEEVVVTGYRQSLQKSEDLKRAAIGSRDSILAEDIADFPDANLAESLQRIPGVSISRDSGEGRQISLRGLGPNFTRTRVNGLEALFTTDSGIDQRGSASRTRNFDFSVFASELFRRVDVRKSYDASLDEGGLAGTVDLYTARPFDTGEEGWQGAVNIRGVHNDRIENTNPRVAALLSNTWGNFGALASVAYSSIDTIEEGYHVWSWRQASFGANNVAPSVDAAVRDRLVNSTGRDRVFVPRANNIASWANTRKRTGITAALQWRPSERLSFDLDMLYGKLSNDRIENQISTAGTNAFTGDVNKGQRLIDAAISGNDLVSASFENLDLRTESKVSFGETVFNQISLQGDFAVTDRLQARALIGRSDSDFDQPIHDKVFSEASNHRFSVDWRNADFGQNTYGFDIADARNWELMRTDVREDQITNSYNTYQIDFDFDIDERHSLHFGLQSKGYESGGFERRNRVDYEDLPGDSAAELARNARARGLTVFQQTQIPILRPYTIADNRATFAALEGAGYISRQLDASFNRPGTVYRIEEDSIAAYLQYEWNLQFGDMPWRGNLGVRWYETDQLSSGEVNTGRGLEQAVFKRSYSDFLPSLNTVLDLSDRWLWRFSANRNISRPSLNQLRAAGQVGVADQFINAGNPNLQRFIADSYETSFEYYGPSTSLVIALFYKDMDSFIVQQSVTLPYRQTGYPLEFLAFDPRVNPDSEFTVSQPVNGDSATVNGVEIALQIDFDFLPQPFNYFGLAANLTRADGETTLFNEGEAVLVTPPGLSKLSHNFTVYYETDVWGARISNSFRDDFITGEGASQNVVAGFSSTTFVDLKAFYNIGDNMKLTFEAMNLTDERLRQFLDHRTQSFTRSGRNFALGFNYSF